MLLLCCMRTILFNEVVVFFSKNVKDNFLYFFVFYYVFDRLIKEINQINCRWTNPW